MQKLKPSNYRGSCSGGLCTSRVLVFCFVFISNVCPIEAASQNEESILASANRLASHNEYSAADSLYLKVLSVNPQNAMAHHMYGRMLALQTRYEEALKEYKLSLKLKPNSPSVLNDVGVALAISGCQPLGARFLHQASVVGQNYPGALNNLGVVLASLDAFKQAREAFARSLEIQPRNAKIKELKQKAEARLANNKEFEYGAAVSWQDVPESLKKLQASVIAASNVKEPAVPDTKPKIAVKVQKAMDEEDKKWLEKSQPQFLELKSSGFSNACFAGNGMVQIGDKSDSADNIGELELNETQKIELMGDVTVDLTGPGELELGTARLLAKGEDCIFSFNAETSELSCYAGDFKVSNWSTVTATKTASKVEVNAEKCLSVYAQDDSKIEARACDEVTLVGHAQGTVNGCKKVIVNDDSRAVAIDCDQLTALANARVKERGCSKLEKLDHAKIESDSK